MKAGSVAPFAPALLALAGGCTAVQAAGCGEDLPAAARQHLAADGLELAFAPSAWPLPAGEFFTLEVVVCEPPGNLGSTLAAVDATMPAHRHGMNYRPRVLPQGPGRYRVEGLLLHMSGRWRLSFELRDASGSRQLSQEIDLP